jgi:glc operon protein GlcG
MMATSPIPGRDGGELVPLTLGEADQLIAAAHQQATALDVRVTVVIVDEGGHVQAAGRMDGSFPLSFRIAEAKAVGAALWQRDGNALKSIHADRPGFFNAVDRLVSTGLVPGPGSVVLKREGVVLGAVGVSGATGEQDLECAEAGVRAVLG